MILRNPYIGLLFAVATTVALWCEVAVKLETVDTFVFMCVP